MIFPKAYKGIAYSMYFYRSRECTISKIFIHDSDLSLFSSLVGTWLVKIYVGTVG